MSAKMNDHAIIITTAKWVRELVPVRSSAAP